MSSTNRTAMEIAADVLIASLNNPNTKAANLDAKKIAENYQILFNQIYYCQIEAEKTRVE